jgi:mannose-6-phosphate isomerase-like protein (cupin superfamily)
VLIVKNRKATGWNDLEWNPLRPDLTDHVLSHGLIPEGATVQSVALTKVAPGGEFATHTDDYHHVFCFLRGEGKGWIGESSYDISSELIVRVTAGTPHGYRNTGSGDLLLITINYF